MAAAEAALGTDIRNADISILLPEGRCRLIGSMADKQPINCATLIAVADKQPINCATLIAVVDKQLINSDLSNCLVAESEPDKCLSHSE